MTPRSRARLGVFLAPFTVLVACSSDGPADVASGGQSSTAIAAPITPGTVHRDMPDSSLPGAEALSPMPPDPRAATVLEQLEQLPAGRLDGTVEFNVSGLTAFAEPVSGRCTAPGETRGFAMSLSDGSALTVEFGHEGGSLQLTAPGIEVLQTLTDVEVHVVDGVQVSAGLLTGGTREPSGRLSLTGKCS